MSIRFIAEAELDLEEAIAYYNVRRPGLGDAFALDVAAGMDRISEAPRAWQSLGPRTRRYRLNRFPYGLVYHALGADILILAVAHHSRSPDYWHERSPGDDSG